MQREDESFTESLETRIKKNDERIAELKKIIRSLEESVARGKKRFGIIDIMLFSIFIFLTILIFNNLGLFDRLKVSKFEF